MASDVLFCCCLSPVVLSSEPPAVVCYLLVLRFFCVLGLLRFSQPCLSLLGRVGDYQRQTLTWFDENVAKPTASRGVNVRLELVRVQNDIKRPGPVFTAITKVFFSFAFPFFCCVSFFFFCWTPLGCFLLGIPMNLRRILSVSPPPPLPISLPLSHLALLHVCVGWSAG